MPSKTLSILKDAYELRLTTGAHYAWQNTSDLICGKVNNPAGTDWVARSFLAFTLNWTDVVKITSATLHVYSPTAVANGRSRVTMPSASWSETTGPEPAVHTDIDIDTGLIPSSGWQSIDITTVLDSWAPSTVIKSVGGGGGGRANYGIRIASYDETTLTRTMSFSSRETSHDPYITLVYSNNVVPDAPSALLVNGVATGSTVVGASDPIITATYHDTDSDAISQYTIDVDLTTASGVQPDWVSPIYTTTITAPNASIVGSAITKTLTGLSGTWARGSWYAVRIRANDGVSGWGPYSYLWMRVNSLPTVTCTEPSATGRLAKMSYTAGSGWASPRMNVTWTYADAQGSAQTKYQVVITEATTSGGVYSAFYDSGQVSSSATSLVVPATFIESRYYKVTVNVFDGQEWSGATTAIIARARWGLATHKKDVSVGGLAPTSWLVSTLTTTTSATSAAILEYNSADDSAGTNLAATWASSLDVLTKRKWVQYRVWLLSWGASPATSASLDMLVIQSSGFTAVPDFWLPAPISGVGGSIELSSHAFGSQSLRIDGNSTSRVVYQSVLLDANTDYILQSRVRSIGNSGAKVVLSDSITGSSPLLATTSHTADADWSYDISSTYFNSGARTSMYVCCIVTGAAGTAALFDGIKVERGRVASPWTPGFVGDPAVIDAGGVQVDASASGVFRLRGSTGGTRDIVGVGSHGLAFGGDVPVYSAATGILNVEGVINSVPVVRVYTGGATWTKPAASTGFSHAIIECIGGGGAGGGSVTGVAGEHSKGGGGGAGSYSRVLKAASALGGTEAVTVGAAGTGASGTTGGSGGDSSFGAHCVGKGGSGGTTSGTSTATFSGALGGSGGVAGTGDFTPTGGRGGYGYGSGALATGGVGADSTYGGGGAPANLNSQPLSTVGSAGTNYGSGGGGSARTGTGAANAGGAGAAGVVIVTEYYAS